MAKEIEKTNEHLVGSRLISEFRLELWKIFGKVCPSVSVHVVYTIHLTYSFQS